MPSAKRTQNRTIGRRLYIRRVISKTIPMSSTIPGQRVIGEVEVSKRVIPICMWDKIPTDRLLSDLGIIQEQERQWVRNGPTPYVGDPIHDYTLLEKINGELVPIRTVHLNR